MLSPPGKAWVRLRGWPFKRPVGYRKDAAQHLVPDPEVAPLVRTAFEMYATGCYTKRQVLDHVTALGLRNYRGEPMSTQVFDGMLVNPLYAGWLVVPQWDVRERGAFEPIVSDELFEAVQARLDGRRPTLTPAQRFHPDFPLRHLVRCGECGRPLTGSWSSGNGGRYPYYFCQEKACKRVKGRKEDLEARFIEFLRRLQPRPEMVSLFVAAALDAWEARRTDASARRLAAERRRRELEDEKTRFARLRALNHIDQEMFKAQVDRLRREEAALDDVDVGDVDDTEVEALVTFAGTVALDAARLWDTAPPAQKQRLQKALFPRGVSFGGTGYRTTVNNLLFNDLPATTGADPTTVAPPGLEPGLFPENG